MSIFNTSGCKHEPEQYYHEHSERLMRVWYRCRKCREFEGPIELPPPPPPPPRTLRGGEHRR